MPFKISRLSKYIPKHYTLFFKKRFCFVHALRARTVPLTYAPVSASADMHLNLVHVEMLLTQAKSYTLKWGLMGSPFFLKHTALFIYLSLPHLGALSTETHFSYKNKTKNSSDDHHNAWHLAPGFSVRKSMWSRNGGQQTRGAAGVEPKLTAAMSEGRPSVPGSPLSEMHSVVSVCACVNNFNFLM